MSYSFKLPNERSQGFTEFRRQMHSHLSSTHHINGFTHRHVLEKKAATQRRAGMAVGRTAYSVLTEAKSYRSFTRLLQLQHINGVYLGDLQHDRGFTPRFLNAAHDEVQHRIKRFMHTVTAATGRKPFFLLAADKLTLLKRNSQAVVLFAIIEGEVRPIYLSAPLVTKHGGRDVANNIKYAGMAFLGLTAEDWKRSFTAMAFDGAYFAIRVDSHLNSITGSLSPAFRTAVWCGAHRLELGFLDIYKCRASKLGVQLPQATWLASLQKKLNAQMDPHRENKGYEEMLEFAAEIGEELRAQLRFSTTRWAASLRSVIKNWVFNWKPTIEMKIRNRTNEMTKFSARDSRTDNRTALRDMMDLKFLLRVIMLEDIMAAAMELSLQFQTVNVLAWEQQKRIKETHGHFVDMVALLTRCAGMTNTSEMWKQIADSGLFPLITTKECKKPNRRETSSEPKVVLNAETIFQDGTYRGVVLITRAAPPVRTQPSRKGKEKKQKGAATAAGAARVLTDHVLALQGAIGDIRDFATCFTQHFAERMLGKEDLPPSGDAGGSSSSATDDNMDEEGVAWEYIRKMGCCFDLLAVALKDPTESERNAQHRALREIHTWAVDQGEMELKDFAGIKGDYEVLRGRLRLASKTHRHKENWQHAKSSLVVIKAIWHSDRGLGAGCMDLLYLMEHCILKTSCEAIVESFCSVIGRHGSAERHCDQGVYTKEAVVVANGPALGHGDDFISGVNDRIFAKNKYPGWHFVTKGSGALRLIHGESSITLDNLARAEKRGFRS
jgi:hypothetical protein